MAVCNSLSLSILYNNSVPKFSSNPSQIRAKVLMKLGHSFHTRQIVGRKSGKSCSPTKINAGLRLSTILTKTQLIIGAPTVLTLYRLLQPHFSFSFSFSNHKTQICKITTQTQIFSSFRETNTKST